jgi:hypothetical protein
MEEFNERVQSTGLSAARRWYWRATLRNMIALAAGGSNDSQSTSKNVVPDLVVWFGFALLWMWLSHRWLMGLEHQAWGIVTLLVVLVYFLLMIGWLVPLLWALIRLVSPSLMRGEQFR